MRVFLGFGGMELRPAGSRDDFGQDPPQRLIGKCDLGWKALLVLGERDEMRERWPVGARKRIPARIEDGMAELSLAVRPKVEEDGRVPIAQRRAVADDVRLEKLVAALRLGVTGAERMVRLDLAERCIGRQETDQQHKAEDDDEAAEIAH